MNSTEVTCVFPASLTAASLKEITAVVKSVCAGNIVFMPRPLLVKFRAATRGMMQQQRLQDGSVGYWTETPEALNQWYRTYWYPLHQAAIDANQIAWQQALVRLYVVESGDLNQHESIHGYYDASALLLSQSEGNNDEQDDHGAGLTGGRSEQRYLAKVWAGRELYRALRLYRFGEQELVRQAFVKSTHARGIDRHREALSSLHQFKRPGILLSLAIEKTCEPSSPEAARQYFDAWLTRLLADKECSSLAAPGAADGDWFREHLFLAASLFTELWRAVFLSPLPIQAETRVPAPVVPLSLQQRRLCASTPYKDRIPDDAHCGDFHLECHFSCEGDGSHHELSPQQGATPVSPPGQSLSSHRNEQEGKDDQIP